ncbi:MAG: RHS repeat protein [Thioploca sp.]|nr:RHS repeat protein [Thioploca sp.]
MRMTPAGRLRQVNYANNFVEQFAYDPAGNLLNQEARYDQGNRLLRFNGYAYEHDARGNLIRKTSAAGTVEYRYNIFNQLIAAQTPQYGLVEFQYDALGRRIVKKSQHREVRYYWNQLELFGEVEADEPIEYVFHNFAPVATLRKGQIYYYHTDHLGTPMEMTDERGRLVWKGDYVTLGRCRGQGEVVNRLRFPGQWEDEETGLHFNVFRYYDAEVGRYVTADPIGYSGGDWNLYRYVRNNFINHIDIVGLKYDIHIHIHNDGIKFDGNKFVDQIIQLFKQSPVESKSPTPTESKSPTPRCADPQKKQPELYYDLKTGTCSDRLLPATFYGTQILCGGKIVEAR